MPKLRNGNNDVEKLVQYLGRKLRNHQPLSELAYSPSEREQLASTYSGKTAHAPTTVMMRADTRNSLLTHAGGRFFSIEVREITEDDYEEPPKLEIGY